MGVSPAALTPDVPRDRTQLEVFPWRRIGFIPDVGVNVENRSRTRELVRGVLVGGGVTPQQGDAGVDWNGETCSPPPGALSLILGKLWSERVRRSQVT